MFNSKPSNYRPGSIIDYNLSDLSLRSCLIHRSWWTSHPMASHGVPWRRVTEDHNFLLAFHGFLQINGARIHIAIRDQDQDASSLAHRPNGTLRVFQCHSISIHFNQSATNIIIIYIHITIYRYGIVAEGSETHHFRGRQNSPKEVPTCLCIQKCAFGLPTSVWQKSQDNLPQLRTQIRPLVDASQRDAAPLPSLPGTLARGCKVYQVYQPRGQYGLVEEMYPLVIWRFAIENGPFIVDLFIKNGDFP